MKEFSIVINDWGHKELQEYLLSLNGILKATVNMDNLLEIYLKYDSNVITPRIIKMEICLFLNILKIPSVLSFDKHTKGKKAKYIIIRDDLCCEYCFQGAIEALLEIEGIEKVESNFYENYLLRKYDEREKIKIVIEYDSNLLTSDMMKQIESELNI